MGGNISKKKGLISEITNENLDYISGKLENTLLNKQDKLTFDDTPISGSDNPVKSGGIREELDKKADKSDVYTKSETDDKLSQKQDKLTFDNWPTTFSDNPVTSGAVRSALDLKADKSHTLSGYGIEDAYTKTEVDTKLSTVYKVKGSLNDYNIFEMATNHEVGDVYNLQGVYTTSYNTTVDKNAFHYTYDSGTSKQYLVAHEISAAYQWLNNAKIKIHTGTDTKTGVLIETTNVPGWELTLDDGTLLTSDVYDTVTSIDLTVYHDFKAGDNVVYIKGGFWDKLAATVDLSGYQDKLTFDDIPTADSTNPVTSGGVKTALDEKADKTEVETVEQTANYARDTANTVSNKIFSTTEGLDTKADKTDLTDYLKITDINSAVRSVRPDVKNTIDTIAVNTIYDLGVQTELNITLPSGQIGDFIEVDFISGETATTLTVNSSIGLVGFDLIPGTNTIYTLYFDWGETGLDGTDITYGWRFNYSEYSITV